MKNKIVERLRAFFHRIFKTENIRRIVQNASYLLSATGITMVIGIIQGALVFRLIGATSYGLIQAIMRFTNTANRITSFRINEMVVSFTRQFMETKEQDKAAAVYKLAVILESIGAVLAFALIWVLAPWGADFFGKNPETFPLWVFYGSLVVLNFSLESSAGLLQVFNRFRTQAILNVLDSVTTFVVVVVAYFSGWGWVEVLVAYYLGKVVRAAGTMVAGFFTARQEWGRGWWRPSIRILRPDFKPMFSFAFSTNLNNTINLVSRENESLWVSAILGTRAAGFYTLAEKIVAMLKFPVLDLSTTTYPELSREIARKRWDEVKDILLRSSRLAAVYFLPLVTLLVLFGKWGMGLVYGAKSLPAYPLLMALTIGHTIENILFWNRVALLALNRPIFPTVINFIATLAKVVLVLTYAPQFGESVFAYVLSGYLIFTSVLIGGRAIAILRQKSEAQANEVTA